MFEIIECTLKWKFFWITTVVILLTYLFLKYITYSYWKKHGVPHDVPTLPFGNVSRELILKRRTLGEEMKNSYEKYKEFPYHGLYMFFSPVLMVNDPDLIKHILVKNFSNFCDRGIDVNFKCDPLSNHLFLNNGNEWRSMRSRISPTFTTIKLKTMFPHIIEIAKDMICVTNESLSESNIIEVKDLLSRYTIDIIFNLAFGLNSNCIRKPSNEFSCYGKAAVETSSLRSVLVLFAPNVLKILNMGLNKPFIIKFFSELFYDMVKQRRMSNENRSDFLNLLIELMDYGEIDKQQEKSPSTETFQKLDILEAAAQAFVFFIAGFETTSSTVTHCLYELALNPDVQEKLQEEIDNVTQSLNDLTYDKIAQFEYLDMVFNETLRKHPSVAVLNRICLKDWKIPGSEYTIPKGMALIISVSGIHRDSNIYTDPDKFDPMRFSKENIAARHTYAFLPFGEGPRNCIGKRLGMIIGKVALFGLLLHYKFSVCNKTLIPNRYSRNCVLQTPESMYLKIERRK